MVALLQFGLKIESKRSEAARPPTRNGPPLCIPDLRARRKFLIGFELEGSFEKRSRNQQSADTECIQKQQIAFDRNEASVFEQDRFEAVNGVGERINGRDG